MAMNDSVIPGGSGVIVIGVNGVPGLGPVSEDIFAVTVRFWLTPPDAEQPGTPVKLATNDESVITAVWQHGALWIGGNEQCLASGDTAPRSCLRVIQIQTDTRSLQQDLTFGAPGRYYYYPALNPDGSGNLVVVFNASSATEFAGVRATGRLTTDPAQTLVPSVLLRGGGGAQTASSRMGDYYGAAMDPADPTKVWVTAEYIRTGTSGDWGTIVTQLTFGAPPTLALALNGPTFRMREVLRVGFTVGNPAAGLSVDIYLGALLPPAVGPGFGCPMGDAIAFVTASSALAIRCRSGSPASFPKFAAGASIPPGPSTFADVFTFTWPDAPAGTYVVFVAFAVSGALDDGDIGPSDIIAITSGVVTFSP
jgi:hypothetical protein